MTPDPTRWQVWWELNKDAYLRAPQLARDPNRPLPARQAIPERMKVDVILPALKRALDDTSNQHITSACMIALAKIGLDHPRFKILDEFRKRLRRGNQEIREVAALAMGISKQPAALADLVALLEDQPPARRATGRGNVDDRTRAFAAYGLGLLAHGSDDLAVKTGAFESLRRTLLDDNQNSRDILIAALNGIRLLNLRPDQGAGHRRLLWSALQTLHEFQARKVSKTRQMVQAHAPPAVARLLGRGNDTDQQRAKQELSSLFTRRTRAHATLYQSATIATGLLARPVEADAGEKELDQRLQRHLRDSRDQLTGYLGLIAMGQIGGATNVDRLLNVLKHGKRSEQGWAGLALGLAAFHAPPPKPVQGTRSPVDPVRDRIGAALYQSLLSTSNRDVRAAVALGLGLCGYQKAAPAMRKMLTKYSRVEEFAGYLALGLAMMDDPAAGQLIEQVMSSASRKPLLMVQTALALARLKHPTASVTLRSILRTGSTFRTIVLASTSNAMGYLADPNNVAPLVSILGDRTNNKLIRAFAAVALGSMAENDALTWSAWIAMNMNYSATVETLSNGSAGILDIL